MLSTGHYLGAVPLATEMAGVKIRFGELGKKWTDGRGEEGGRAQVWSKTY